MVLVSCSKSKREGVHRAADLYGPSDIFQKRRTFSRREGDYWGVLSGKYGYLRPWEAVPDYEMHRSERSDVWAAFVLRDLLPDLDYWGADRVTILAGKAYVDPLLAELEAEGYDVLDYNRGLRPGERKAALKEANQPGKQGTLTEVEA
ncbi:Uncharacterized protein HSRCO_0268 [Halanaeroarchaeum sp. HSR-CO]|nr:Uncharacterized protein HSRCO_0268 [Halanaeroarchaeum sp. HSR-CO]